MNRTARVAEKRDVRAMLVAHAVCHNTLPRPCDIRMLRLRRIEPRPVAAVRRGVRGFHATVSGAERSQGPHAACDHVPKNLPRARPVTCWTTMSSSSAASAAIRRLTIEYKQLTSDPNTLFPAVGPISEDNYLEWEALLPGPDDTPFEGGVFSARLSFRTCQVLTTQRRHPRWTPRKCASTRRSSTRTVRAALLRSVPRRHGVHQHPARGGR